MRTPLAPRRSAISRLRNSLRLVLPALAALVLHAAGAAAQSASVSLSGQVTDRENGRPLAWATVLLMDLNRRTQADSEGNFAFENVPAGAHYLVVAHLGYADHAATVTAAAEMAPLPVGLARDPITLERLTVQTDRLESRRLRTPEASRVFGTTHFARFGRPDAVQFLRDMTGMIPTDCPVPELRHSGCAWVRGSPQPVRLVLDERASPGGLFDLRGIPLRDLYRVEVYEGGALVVAYTRHFMEAMLRRNAPLHPIRAIAR